MSGQQYEQKAGQIPGALGREIASSEAGGGWAGPELGPRQGCCSSGERDAAAAGDRSSAHASLPCLPPHCFVLHLQEKLRVSPTPADEERGEQQFDGVNRPSAAARTEGRAEGAVARDTSHASGSTSRSGVSQACFCTALHVSSGITCHSSGWFDTQAQSPPPPAFCRQGRAVHPRLLWHRWWVSSFRSATM